MIEGTSHNPALTPAGCTPSLFTSFIQGFGILYFGCHGSGWDCSGSSNFYPTIIDFASVPTLPTSPIIFTVACYDAEIPGTALIAPLANYYSRWNYPVGGPTISQAFFASGASAFIGVTIEGFTDVTPGAEGSLYSAFTEAYAPGVVAPTLGQDFLQEKRLMETTNQNNLVDPIKSTYIVDTGYAMQLYGDPTLTYNSLG
jgi:hypothetical protein